MTIAETVARLDYSKPPPGYAVAWRTHGACEWSLMSPEGIRLPRPANGCDDIAEYATQRLALTAAWAHYKTHNDPPGMSVDEVSGPDAAWRWCVSAAREHRGLRGTNPAARSAAWAWHDRRHALSARISAEERSRRRWLGRPVR